MMLGRAIGISAGFFAAVTFYQGCITPDVVDTDDPIMLDTVFDTGAVTEDVPDEYVPSEDYGRHCDILPPEKFSEYIDRAAFTYDVNPRVIALTVYRESRCKQDALGGSGEIGLGQINPRVWTKVLREQGLIEEAADLYDPLTNLRATAYVLSECLRYAKGNHQDALRRYNGSGIQAERYAAAQAAKYYMLWGETLWLR